MVDIDALMRALPISSLEPYHVASIRGVGNPLKKSPWDRNIDFLEPPAGQRLPYIHPLDALEKLLGSQEETHDEWLKKAQLFERELKLEITSNKWARFYHHLEPDMQEAIPVPDFLAWLRKKSIVSSKITDLFEEANAAAIKTPIFTGPDNRGSPWSLETLPDLPPAKAMIEFVPGPSWDNEYDSTGKNTVYEPFLLWRTAIRPVAQALEQELGEPVYRFADLELDYDDDDVHRFLVLHWCFTLRPDALFTQHIVRLTGARDVEELKAALIHPLSYKHPYEMNYSFAGLEAHTLLFDIGG
ncbi:hypothetical protein [Brucella sp. 2716]|uniref:hypothetical protein n=1 Tax=Brucella sp. 2716 TaxID=2975052 RepID=UPI00217DF184|nr:hypothetical protein [Brucella sp. 2716]UWF60380.1 hypothetical protein NYO66_15450 [Brucella sp. 2716]